MGTTTRRPRRATGRRPDRWNDLIVAFETPTSSAARPTETAIGLSEKAVIAGVTLGSFPRRVEERHGTPTLSTLQVDTKTGQAARGPKTALETIGYLAMNASHSRDLDIANHVRKTLGDQVRDEHPSYGQYPTP